MKRIVLLLVMSLALSPLLAQEKGYKVVRPDGSVEYTDQPAAGAKEFVLPKAQTYEAPTLPTWESSPQTGKQQKVEGYQLNITSPSADQTYQAGDTAVTVRVEVQPDLQAGHTLVILLDGVVVAEGKTIVSLGDVERGTHAINAEVRDASGTVIASGTPVTFHRFQPSILFPGRVPPPAPLPPTVPVPPAPAPTPPPIKPTP